MDEVDLQLLFVDFLIYLLELAAFWTAVIWGVTCFVHCKSRR